MPNGLNDFWKIVFNFKGVYSFWALLQAAKKYPCSSSLKTKFYWTQKKVWSLDVNILSNDLSPYHLHPSIPRVLLEPPYLAISYWNFRVCSVHLYRGPWPNTKITIKFRFSKKTTKFETISHMIWRLLSKCQVKWEIVSSFCCLFRMSELYQSWNNV